MRATLSAIEGVLERFLDCQIFVMIIKLIYKADKVLFKCEKLAKSVRINIVHVKNKQLIRRHEILTVHSKCLSVGEMPFKSRLPPTT